VAPKPDDPAHDVLAAEAFAMPARDPDLNAGPVLLPDDPTGIAEPHDVLAAEEFPMPAPGHAGGGLGAVAARAGGARGIAVALGAIVAVALILRLLRRR
jgi:hypothetical protein